MSDMQIRVSDADRERITQRLQQAFTEGRLDHLELEDRLGRALTAKVGADLTKLVEDLPAATPSAEEEAVLLETVHDHVKRTGDWAVPRRLRIVTKHGGAHLDFTEAVVLHPVVEIELELKYGSAKIVLPEGATANVDGFRTTYGSASSTVAGRPRPGALHVVVTGGSKYGQLAVRYPRKRWFTQS
ncbi:DUF1707 SHOCT-like domain-containing protein [Nonomuraea glycinis]|jgi:hypothetical protein|uniref:DUF1707 SHOCT-like domain-containing protein n=1 Tax=Nonomuraea glycinis TaxID=2047744 RepID=UPI002E111C31|nr:DUF1707 domain-containing protein [Nonomuraea glycinis]